MMRAINIIGIVASVAAFLVAIYYIEETSSARWRSYDFYWDYDNDYSYTGPSAADVTIEGGLFSLLFTLYFVMVNIVNLIKIKTMTTKVLSIIGISLNGILLIVNLVSIVFSHDAHYDESTGPAWILFSPIILGFSIVYLVQSVKWPKPVMVSQKTLDDIIREDDIV